MYSAKFIKNGNIKVGNMWTWNKLAGNGIIAGCKGTCGEHCQGCYNPEQPKKSDCYVFKSYITYGWDKSTVVASHVKNTNAMRNDIEKTFEELRTQIRRAKNKPSVIRIHAAGELETANELVEWINTAKMFPETTFYLYTKTYRLVDAVLSELNALPSNFFINISIWHENGVECFNKWKKLDGVRCFIYDDGYQYDFDIDCHCPAYDKSGKLHHDLTCDKCKICFQNKAKVCSCYAH